MTTEPVDETSAAAGAQPPAAAVPPLDTPAPRPTPLPLPVDEPRSRHPRARLAIAVSVVLVVVLSVFGVGFVVYTGIRDGLPFDPFGFMDEGPSIQGAWWSGNGEFAVGNFGRNGRPAQVVVWDRRTGALRTVSGYRVVAVETVGARAWVVPAPKVSDDDAEASWDIAGDGFDAPQHGLLALSLTAGSPVRPSSPTWEPWPNGRGVQALLSVEPSKGAEPAKLRFRSKDGKLVTADIPHDVATFSPVGWSPSGRYFAIRPLESVEGEEAPAFSHAMVFSAQDGSLVASFRASTALNLDSQGLAWDARRDILFGAATKPDEENETSVIRYLDVRTGREADAVADGLLKTSKTLSSAYQLSLLGATSERGLIVLAQTENGTEIWQLSAERARRSGDGASIYGGSWDPRGGFVYAGDGATMELHVSAIDGSHAKTIWTEGKSR